MEGIRIEIDFKDLHKLGALAHQLEANASDTYPLMEDIADYGVESTKDRFEFGVSPDGQKWAPSGRVKMAQGNAQTLVDSRRLLDSITPANTSTQAFWGTNVPYAGIHHIGGTIKPKSAPRLKFKIPGLGFRTAMQVIIPARPFMGVNADDEVEIGNLIAEHLQRGIQ